MEAEARCLKFDALLGRPDAAVMRWDCEPRFLERRHTLQIQPPAMELFDIVAADWKPKRHHLILVAGIDRHQGVLRTRISSEQENAAREITIPMIEKEVRAASNMLSSASDAKQAPGEPDQRPSRVVVEKIPA